jgi:hypothetical protein
MERLFRARISFENNNADRRSWLDMTAAPKGEFLVEHQRPGSDCIMGKPDSARARFL